VGDEGAGRGELQAHVADVVALAAVARQGAHGEASGHARQPVAAAEIDGRRVGVVDVELDPAARGHRTAQGDGDRQIDAEIGGAQSEREAAALLGEKAAAGGGAGAVATSMVADSTSTAVPALKSSTGVACTAPAVASRAGDGIRRLMLMDR
jgi:hypothetical protein